MKSTGNYFYVKKPKLESRFTQIPNNTFRLNLTSTEKLILIFLFSNAENFRITAYRIKQDIGSDYRTVKKALNKFQELSFITWNENVITLNIDVINNSNSTNSNLTNSNPTNSNPDVDNSKITNSTNSKITNTTDSNPTTTNSNPTTNMIVELPSNNTEPIQEEKTNQEKEKQKEEPRKDFSSDLDFLGGSVPVQVTLAAPPMGSLASPKPSLTPSSNNINKDDITRVNNPVTIHHTPIKVEERSDTKENPTNELVKYPDDQVRDFIKNDQLLQSVYFGEKINIHAVRHYLNAPLEIRNNLTYLQFEAYIMHFLAYVLYRGKESREHIIKELSEGTDRQIRFFGENIKAEHIQNFKTEEDKIIAKLQAYKL